MLNFIRNSSILRSCAFRYDYRTLWLWTLYCM